MQADITDGGVTQEVRIDILPLPVLDLPDDRAGAEVAHRAQTDYVFNQQELNKPALGSVELIHMREGPIQKFRICGRQDSRREVGLDEIGGIGWLGKEPDQIGVLELDAAVFDQCFADDEAAQRDVVRNDPVAPGLGHQGNRTSTEKGIDEDRRYRRGRQVLEYLAQELALASQVWRQGLQAGPHGISPL